MSPPTRVVWIEIGQITPVFQTEDGSPPTRVVWIEILLRSQVRKIRKSPPTRVVWIEINTVEHIEAINQVTTHTGGVD